MSIVYSENMTMMPTRLVASTCIRLTGQELQEGERFLGILQHHLLTATPRPGRSAQGSVMPTTELHQAVGTVDTPLLHHLLHDVSIDRQATETTTITPALTSGTVPALHLATMVGMNPVIHRPQLLEGELTADHLAGSLTVHHPERGNNT